MSETNGKVVDYQVNENLMSHVYKEIEMLKPGDVIDDCLNQRIKYLFYEYEDIEEMRAFIKNKDNIVNIEIERI